MPNAEILQTINGSTGVLSPVFTLFVWLWLVFSADWVLPDVAV